MRKLFNSISVAWLNKLAGKAGYQFIPLQQPLQQHSSYLDANETISRAQQQSLSVCEYVEQLWDQQGWTDYVIQEMGNAGSLSPGDCVCEIGPGTGRYLERVLKQVSPRQYDIYEIADDWATWLVDTYGPTIVRNPADGKTLCHTRSYSCHLVHAHGVFTYLNALHSFSYFTEMSRICAIGGYIVFDFCSDEDFTPEIIRKWLSSQHSYLVILPYKTVVEYFHELGFQLIHQFNNKYGQSFSCYVIFHKIGSRT